MILIMFAAISKIFEDGSPIRLAKGDALFRGGAKVRSMYHVLEGQVELVRHSEGGIRIVLFQAGAGCVPAEASAYSKRYHCDGIASETSRLHAIPVKTFCKRLDQDPGLAKEWAAMLSHALQGARMNAEIRTLRTVAERLDVWLSLNKVIPPKGCWLGLSQTLGVTPEALYRELSVRRRQAR
jgi:CRP-like cAMP-binding protein